MLQIFRVRHKSIRATKDPLRECLVDGSEKATPIIKTQPTVTTEPRRMVKDTIVVSDGGSLIFDQYLAIA